MPLSFSRFQPTYEELKLVGETAYTRAGGGVFSLPMRNWNSVSPISGSMGPEAFSAYLWGIETKTPVFLRRDALGFQPTYEELKPAFFAHI